MKIGIVTFTYGENYGQRLQNYAMQEVLKQYAEYVVTIKQRRPIKNIIHEILFYLKNIFKPKRIIQKIHRKQAFNRFDRENIQFYRMKLGKKRCLQSINKSFDWFVCGSDQIWSPYSADVNDMMFLRFADFEKRICYAPSIAANYIPKEKEENYIKYFKGFQYLSLREDNLVDYVKEISGVETTVVLDPTLLVSANEWYKLAKKPDCDCIEKKYVLFYFLGKGKKTKELRLRLEREGYQVIDIMHDDAVYTISPSEFLYLIYHASLVVTDSYHGTLFSIQFQVPFVICSREGESIDMSSRFDTLDKKFHLKQRYIDNIDNDSLFEMDFKEINRKIFDERIHSIKYLDKCLLKKDGV